MRADDENSVALFYRLCQINPLQTFATTVSHKNSQSFYWLCQMSPVQTAVGSRYMQRKAPKTVITNSNLLVKRTHHLNIVCIKTKMAQTMKMK